MLFGTEDKAEDDAAGGGTTIEFTAAGSAPVESGLALLGAEGPASAFPLAGLLEEDACSDETCLPTARLGRAVGAKTD